ncbi:MAG: type VI secretion system ATPase TssH, partial [Deinococcota bacterium]|nr:type VI secretion system ATPase TssH [Deinococcota bacterium]
MDGERFTETALAAVANAQAVARSRGHQHIVPAHLLLALLADSAGPAAKLVARAGGNLKQIEAALNAAVTRLPKVSGGDGQYLNPDLAKAFERAE